MPTKRKREVSYGNLESIYVKNKKHTLDSDEEDSDDYEKEELCESDIEGAEDGVSKIQDEIKITPFNMKEELEEGHFDKEGHYHWNKLVNDVEDNWLDNVDWVKALLACSYEIKAKAADKIGKNKTQSNLYKNAALHNLQIKKENKNLRKNDTDGAIESIDIYNESFIYKQLLSYMIEGETIAGSLLRLGKSRPKMSTVERFRLKKQGIKNENEDKIIKLTGLANEILTKTGNMDIYETTYEQIKEKLNSFPCTSKKCSNFSAPNCDMYSDDFNENTKLDKGKSA